MHEVPAVMRSCFENQFVKQVVLSVIGLMVCGQASATIIDDNYWGADGFANYADRDRIGKQEYYEVFNMEVTFTDLFMNVKVNTNFVNSAATPNPHGVDYGDLFISINGWNPTGSATDHYRTDNANNGEKWEYVFDTSEGALYGGGFTILNSNDFFDPADNIYFRNGPQEVQRGTGGDQKNGSSVNLASAGANNGGFIEYNILLSGLGGLTTGDIGLRWAMTCANDTIEGAVRYSVPEPATILMFGLGLLGLGITARRQQSK